MFDTVTYARGQIYWRIFPDTVHKEKGIISKTRPVVIVSNNIGNAASNIITVVPLTTSPRKRPLPTHININCNGTESWVLCEQITTVSKETLGDYIATVIDDKMQQIDLAVGKALGLFKIDFPDYTDTEKDSISAKLEEHESLIPDVKEKESSKKENKQTSTRTRYSDEERFDFLIEYDQALHDNSKRDDLVTKWKLRNFNAATGMAYRFKKKLGV